MCAGHLFWLRCPRPTLYWALSKISPLLLICWLLYGFALWSCADVLVWGGYGPSCTQGDFFEVGIHDGAHKGWVPVIVPFEAMLVWQAHTLGLNAIDRPKF